jgi:two-component system, NtrC family, response regulator HydG
MPLLRKLSPKQRDFFTTLDRTAFCNPFSELRLELDLQLSEADRNLDRTQVSRRALAKVGGQLAGLDKEGIVKISEFAGQDAAILHTAFLFEIYHHFQNEFDNHIRKQLESGNKPVQVSFAPKAIAAFLYRGFHEMEACRYLAFFFQLRRAFFFIDHNLVGDCPSMNTLRCRLWNNIFTHDTKWFEHHLWDRMEDFSTLLLGETGSGKGAAAAAIGRSGHIPFDHKSVKFGESFNRNFISRNLSQFSETLIESELFGHKKGAFTGAVSDYRGVFDQCSPHGAIFLDEIGDLSPPIQIKLLQILQERVFSPVGSHEQLRFSGRVIAATNRPIQKLRKEGKFRDDFFYRLCSDVIEVPSLHQRTRENPNEIFILLERVIERITGNRQPELVRTMRSILDEHPGRNYPWPGNVRELEQAVRRILLCGRYEGEIREAAPDLKDAFKDRIAEGRMSAQEVLAGYCDVLYKQHGTFEQVARITGLDRRTAKKYVLSADELYSSKLINKKT